MHRDSSWAVVRYCQEQPISVYCNGLKAIPGFHADVVPSTAFLINPSGESNDILCSCGTKFYPSFGCIDLLTGGLTGAIQG
jgi:hypothetical protein